MAMQKSTKTKQEPDGEDGPSITTAGLQPHSSMTVTQRATGWKVETHTQKKLASLSVPFIECNDKISIQGRLH